MGMSIYDILAEHIADMSYIELKKFADNIVGFLESEIIARREAQTE